MKFYSVDTRQLLADIPQEDYKGAHEVGVIRVGREYFYFRAGLKHYAVPYGDLTRIFRRIKAVPARLCCGRGNIEIQSLVICTKKSAAEDAEAAEIPLPDARSAKALWEELKAKLPEVDFTAPAREEASDAAPAKAEASET